MLSLLSLLLFIVTHDIKYPHSIKRKILYRITIVKCSDITKQVMLTYSSTLCSYKRYWLLENQYWRQFPYNISIFIQLYMFLLCIPHFKCCQELASIHKNFLLYYSAITNNATHIEWKQNTSSQYLEIRFCYQNSRFSNFFLYKNEIFYYSFGLRNYYL